MCAESRLKDGQHRKNQKAWNLGQEGGELPLKEEGEGP